MVALIIRFQFDSLIRKRRVSVGFAEFMMNHILQQTSFSYFNYIFLTDEEQHSIFCLINVISVRIDNISSVITEPLLSDF